MSNRFVMVVFCLGVMFFPQHLCCADWFGNFTYRGKVVDADTLQPIEGAVVVAKWEKCWPGIGAGEACDFSMAREALTDKNGEWSITGPEGTWDPTALRTILGFVFRWTQPPFFIIYKPGYFPFGEYGSRSPIKGFQASAYVNKDKGLEGIIFERPGDTDEERREFYKDLDNRLRYFPVKNPAVVLSKLQFSFQYSDRLQYISDHDFQYSQSIFWVLGLKKVKTRDEWFKVRFTPGSVMDWSSVPLLRGVVNEEMMKPVEFND